MTARITAAARALCRQAAIECGVNEADNWGYYRVMYLIDARAALEAADGVGKLETDKLLNKLLKANKLLEETLKHYRDIYGVIGTVQDKKTPDA